MIMCVNIQKFDSRQLKMAPTMHEHSCSIFVLRISFEVF